jgi:Na+/melibiose symporter-like transporter
MVLEILGAAILMAFGFLAIYWSLEEKFDDRRIVMIFFLGLAAIVAGGWIILSSISLAVILTKIAGIILGLIGGFLVIGFPDTDDYQPHGMSKAGIFIGMILLIFGLYLIFF